MTLKRTLLAVLTAAALTCASRPAEAKLFEIWGSGLAGGGWGQGGTDRDFYNFVSGGAAGVEVGVKILFIGAFVDYLRWFGGSSGANLLTFNLGGDYALNLSKRFALVFRLAGGYYLGGGLDRTVVKDNIPVQYVSTRGVGVRGGVGLRFSFAKVFSIGVAPEVGYHYFFGGADEDPSKTDQNSSGFDLAVLGYLRVGFGF
jgi:hypothetical protein